MRLLTYAAIAALTFFTGYNSVYFRNLDEVKAERAGKAFDAVQYSRMFWDTKLLTNLDKAVEAGKLIELLSTDPANAFETYSHALGIGNIRYFFVTGKGVVESIDPNGLTIKLEANKQIRIATEFIFGNAVRDATGLISMNEFDNTMDFNNVTEEINKIIRSQVIPPFLKNVKKGDVVEFTGGVELNREHLHISSIEVVPVQATIQ